MLFLYHSLELLFVPGYYVGEYVREQQSHAFVLLRGKSCPKWLGLDFATKRTPLSDLCIKTNLQGRISGGLKQ